ncbi:MAG TPA: hypothetical protein VMV77_21540 [Bacteroidales bacterium]|nr:hypothetical protein [Bacteroidales bacterium]
MEYFAIVFDAKVGSTSQRATMFSVSRLRRLPLPCPPMPIPAMFSLSLGGMYRDPPKTCRGIMENDPTVPASKTDLLINSRRSTCLLIEEPSITGDIPVFSYACGIGDSCLRIVLFKSFFIDFSINYFCQKAQLKLFFQCHDIKILGVLSKTAFPDAVC